MFVANERKFKPLIFSSKSCLYYDFVYSSKINTQNFIEYFYELNGGQYLNFIDDINYFHVIDSSFDEISFFNKKYDKYLSHYQKIICNHFVVDMADIYSKYFSLKSNIQLKLEYEIKELEINKSFIAVHVRGTDFRREIKRHPIFLESDEYFKKIDDI